MAFQAGLIAARNYAASQQAVSENSWDPDKLIQESMKARSAEKQAAMKAESEVRQTKNNIKGEMARVQGQLDIYDAEMDLKKGLRKAGLVAAAGTLAAKGLIKTPDPQKPYQSNLAPYQTLIESKSAQLADVKSKQAELEARGPDYPTRTERPKYGKDTSTPPTSAVPSPPSSAAPSPSSPSVSQSSRFSPVTIKGLSEIRRVESGPFGYNAYNLGGRTEFEPIGSADASKDNRFGKPLTSMTIGEIKRLGAEGKIHATGAYQFTHNSGSFGEAARFAGLSDDDLFTPENQDMMAYQFGRTYDWSRWSGLKRDSAARDAAIAGFSSPLL